VIHSFPFYIADWRDSSARRRFNVTERVCYMELFIFCWIDGFLPSDETELIAITGLDKRDFRAAWKRVQEQFYLQDGTYRHHKVDEGRPRLESWRAGRSKGAKATNDSRAKAKAIANANGTLKRTPPSSSSSSSEENPPTPFELADDDAPEDLARDLYAMWPEKRRNTLKGIMDEIVAILSTSGPNAERDITRIRDNAKAYLARQDDLEFCMGLAKWLRKGEWQNACKPAHDPGPQYISADEMLKWQAAKDERDRLKWEASQSKAGNA
jgi:uncharacterized protein YdaU (DUF1376 family)